MKHRDRYNIRIYYVYITIPSYMLKFLIRNAELHFLTTVGVFNGIIVHYTYMPHHL